MNEENNHVDTAEEYTHLSLCAGYGGIDLGLEMLGIHSCFTVYVEVEAFASYNLAKKIESGALGEGVVWPDLKTFPYRKFRGGFDILSGGFPCQPFSQAGKGHGDEDPRHLFPYILEGIRECRPELVVLENVDGIASAKLKGSHWRDPAGTPVLLHVLRELERVGYRATAVPSSASEVGAPHQRNRWFIIGVAYIGHEGLQGLWESGRIGLSKGWQAEEGYLTACCGFGQAWPSRPGEEQYEWEPPRVLGDSADEGFSDGGSISLGEQRGTKSEPERSGSEGELDNSKNVGRQESGQVEGHSFEPPDRRQIEPPLGRNPYGSAGGLDYAELCVACDNRTDELRLLGNGVVPQSCALAVYMGLQELLG